MNRLTALPIVALARELWRYSEGRRHVVVAYVTLSAVANLVGLLEPLFMSRVFTAAQSSAAPLRTMVTNLLLVLASVVVFWLFHGMSRVLEQRNAFLVRRDYKLAMMRRITELPTSWHTEHHSGDTLDKVNRAAGSLYSIANEGFIFIGTAVGLVGSLVILAKFAPWVALAAAAASAVTCYILTRFDRRLVPGYIAVNAAENALATVVHDAISNIATVITLRLQVPVLNEITRRADVGYARHARNARTNEWKWCTADVTIAVMVAAALIVSAVQMWLSPSGMIVIGALYMLNQYLREVGRVFRTFAEMYGSVIQWHTNVLVASAIEEAHASLVHPPVAALSHDWRELQIRDLRFRYSSGVGRAHVDGIDLTIRRGQRIAFIGESGSGKSTTLALLRGLYPPQQGTLSCDGLLQPHGLAHLSGTTTLVPQSPDIFKQTVLVNVTMDVEHDAADVARAIELACFDSVVGRLPHGLETNVMEKGVSLSGGENQRLALARGLLAADGSTLLLLDESTSSVDAINEDLIYRRIFAAYPDVTILACVHGLDLLPRFDEIHLFDGGRILAKGTYQQLLRVPAFQRMLARGDAS